MKIGILTSGGDCPGLNATIRGAAKAIYERIDDAEIIGIIDGYRGLIQGEYRKMEPKEFSGILTQGGTILGTSRQPYKLMRVVENNVDKVRNMKDNYKKMGLDCLLILGGNGTHKTAKLLSDEGLNVIGLPKTIDNDIWGTDVTFGFHTAVDIATEVIDRIHTTASSHKRVMVIEIMGNKAGWLTLYSSIAGGADIVVLPEIPFDLDSIAEAIQKRSDQGKHFSIVVAAEGAMDREEAQMKKKERKKLREERGETTATNRIANGIIKRIGFETRTVVPGHIVRGGSPSSYDRVLATQFGVYAAELIEKRCFGVTVAMKNNIVTHNPLSEVAGMTKFVPVDHQMIRTGRMIGMSFGD